MDLNANDLASLNIMEYSLCLDDHPTISKQSTSSKGSNFAKLKSSIMNKTNKTNETNDKQMNTFNSFYLTNDYETGSVVSDGNENREQMNKVQRIDNIEEEEEDVDHVEDDEDEVVFNLKGEYEHKSDTSQNKRSLKSNQYSNVNNSDVTSNSSNSINTNTNVIELDSVKHKLSSIWNNVKYGWANYLKKPNKIELNSHEPIYILGKKFFYSELEDDDNESNTVNTNTNLERKFNDYFDALNKNKSNKQPTKNMNSLNESYFNAPSLSSILATNEYDDDAKNRHPISKPQHLNSINANNDDYLSMTYSYLSTSPFETNLASVFGKSSQFSRENSFKQRKAKSDIQLNTPNIYERFLNEKIKTPLDQEIYSRLWFTYRKDFEPLDGNTKYTTDCGWGCMLRSAQMLIAQGLLMHLFNNDWSLYKSLTSNKNYNIYKEIICLFNDRPSLSCPFGLHRLLKIADEKINLLKNDATTNLSGQASNNKLSNNTRVGTWFGPTSVCLLMKDALNESLKKPNAEILNNIQIYVAQDCTIFKQDVIDMCQSSKETKNSTPDSLASASSSQSIYSFTPCILLISARLGGEELNEIYVESLKMFLEMDICIGIIGGKPKHSLYFIGYQGDKVIYLDPHFCQPTVNIFSNNDKKLSSSLTQLSVSTSSSKHSYDDSCLTSSSVSNSSECDLIDNSSFHCGTPSKVAFSKLDPSIAIGFYCRTLNDLNRLCDLVKETSVNELIYPIFGVSDGRFEEAQYGNYQSLSLDEKFLTNNINTNSNISFNKTKVSSSLEKPPHAQIETNNKVNNSKSSAITSYLTSKLSNKMQTNSGSIQNDARRNLFSSNNTNISSSSSSNANRGGILSPSKNKKTTKKSPTDPDDFVLV